METQTIVAALVITISLFYIPAIWSTFVHNRKLKSIPSIGPSGTLNSYIGAFRFLRHGREMLQQGYDKYYGSVFEIPTLTSWLVVITSGGLIEDLRRAPEEDLSGLDAFRETFFLDITLPGLLSDPFHLDLTKGPLTKNIGAKFADVHNEIAVAFNEYIPVKGDEWTKVTAYTTVLDIVVRTSNRMFVGLPLCRNADWIELNKEYTLDIAKAAMFLGMLPSVLRHIVAPFLGISKGIKRATRHVEPLIRERLEQETQQGKDWPEKPNDIISWMLDLTRDNPRSLRDLVIPLLGMNFVSIHTTTITLTYVLFELATHPEYIQPLRDEVEAVINDEGWSKDSVQKLRKVDSFIKDVCGYRTLISVVTIARKARKDFTFSDGTMVPAGSMVVVPFNAVHTDANNYVKPDKFDGFRFEEMREQEGEETKHQLVSLGVDYILFGHGRHACPGRFFVANELKAMLAHVLLNYDIKMADGRGRPENWQVGIYTGPDMNAKMLFRKRRI